ncbi:MAG: CdaR family protein [Acidobacteriota bacterium]|nr:CdaR family protein [Acidobacteriota bacterium]
MRSRWLFQDLGLRLFAVALATVLWLMVSGDPIAERGLRVPIAFENLPESLEILTAPPDTVEVRLRGPSGTLRRLDSGDVVAFIDLRMERPGPRLFNMTADRIRAPLGVQVIQVLPSTVALTMEAMGGPRAIPVMPTIRGAPAAGFVVGSVRSEPAMVDVVGPQSLVSTATGALTEPLDVANASSTVVQMVTVGVADPHLRLVTPRLARVTVDIVWASVERRLADVPVRVRNRRSGLRSTLSPPTVAVTVHGSPEQMRGLDVTAVGATVDLADLGPGRYDRVVVVEPHRAFAVTLIEPSMVEVTLR